MEKRTKNKVYFYQREKIFFTRYLYIKKDSFFDHYQIKIKRKRTRKER